MATAAPAPGKPVARDAWVLLMSGEISFGHYDEAWVYPTLKPIDAVFRTMARAAPVWALGEFNFWLVPVRGGSALPPIDLYRHLRFKVPGESRELSLAQLRRKKGFLSLAEQQVWTEMPVAGSTTKASARKKDFKLPVRVDWARLRLPKLDGPAIRPREEVHVPDPLYTDCTHVLPYGYTDFNERPG